MISNITDKAAYNYFIRQANKTDVGKNFSVQEKLSAVKKVKRQALSYSALLGALGVVLLYLPAYIFPDLFPKTTYTIPYINFDFEISINELIYGFFLVAFEIWLLMLGDIKTVSKIALIYGFNPKQVNIEEEIDELVYIAIGKDRKKSTEVGINPFQNIGKTGVILLRGIFILKALLSNFVFRIVLKRLLGKLAVRMVIEFAGIPIYAFWNAYASSIVVRKSSMRMLASDLMNSTANRFLDNFKNDKKFKNLIYDIMGYIAVTKKSFYPTDYLFAKHFFETFNIKIKKQHKIPKDFIAKISKLDDKTKLAVGQILIIGFLIDGKIGTLEIRIIKKLQKQGIIPYSIEQIKTWTKQYLNGKGFSAMYEA